ncbi:hypothetical protein GCM10011418_13220 [Sphingobacterium alkalisoli]|nr:GDSL-type esterase/lipase family protein [Sphingobacterium alkalisoli]GGH13189.1 hypothetical protein GCM10011418_13220 [Sphingobacterium alkalisoli]
MYKRIFTLGLFLVVFSTVSFGQRWHEAHLKRMDRYQSQVDAYLKSDAVNMPDTGAILFIGSSSFRIWGDRIKDAFPNHKVFNRAFGGSHLYDVLQFFDLLVVPYRPVQIFLYEGDNDIPSGMKTQEYLQDVITFVRMVEIKLPGTEVALVSIKPSPARMKWEAQYLEANRMMRDFADTKAQVHYIDVTQSMYDQKGRLRKELFAEDMVHLNQKGYQIWQPLIAPYLSDKAKK